MAIRTATEALINMQVMLHNIREGVGPVQAVPAQPPEAPRLPVSDTAPAPAAAPQRSGGFSALFGALLGRKPAPTPTPTPTPAAELEATTALFPPSRPPLSETAQLIIQGMERQLEEMQTLQSLTDEQIAGYPPAVQAQLVTMRSDVYAQYQMARMAEGFRSALPALGLPERDAAAISAFIERVAPPAEEIPALERGVRLQREIEQRRLDERAQRAYEPPVILLESGGDGNDAIVLQRQRDVAPDGGVTIYPMGEQRDAGRDLMDDLQRQKLVADGFQSLRLYDDNVSILRRTKEGGAIMRIQTPQGFAVEMPVTPQEWQDNVVLRNLNVRVQEEVDTPAAPKGKHWFQKKAGQAVAAMGVATVLAGPVYEVGRAIASPAPEAAELRNAIINAGAREEIKDLQMVFLEDEQRLALFNKYIATEPEVYLDYDEIWNKKDGVGDFARDAYWNMSSKIEIMGNFYFDAYNEKLAEEGKAPVTFYEFMDKFMGDLKAYAQATGTDFQFVLAMTELSAKNTATRENYNTDVSISKVQMVLGAVGRFMETSRLRGLWEQIPGVSAMTSEQAIGFWATDISNNNWVTDVASSVKPNLPMTKWDSIRLTGISTVGYNDIEPELVGQGVNALPEAEREAFYAQYPEFRELFSELERNRALVDQSKHEVALKVYNISDNWSVLMTDFFSPDPAVRDAAYSAIGLDAEHVAEQLNYRSRAWRHATELEFSYREEPGQITQPTSVPDANPVNFRRRPNHEEMMQEIVDRVRGEIDWIYNNQGPNGPREAMLAILRDQLDNPRFLEYLQQKAEERGIQAESAVGQLVEELGKLDERTNGMALANANVLTAMSRLEYDLDFQIKTGLATIRNLGIKGELISGEMDRTEKPEWLKWVRDTMFIREMSPSTLLAAGWEGFPELPGEAMPYTPNMLIATVRQFEQMIVDRGVIPAGEENNAHNWWYIYNDFRNNAGRGVLTDEEGREAVHGYFLAFVFPKFAPGPENGQEYLRRNFDPNELNLNLTVESREAQIEGKPIVNGEWHGPAWSTNSLFLQQLEGVDQQTLRLQDGRAMALAEELDQAIEMSAYLRAVRDLSLIGEGALNEFWEKTGTDRATFQSTLDLYVDYLNGFEPAYREPITVDTTVRALEEMGLDQLAVQPPSLPERIAANEAALWEVEARASLPSEAEIDSVDWFLDQVGQELVDDDINLDDIIANEADIRAHIENWVNTRTDGGIAYMQARLAAYPEAREAFERSGIPVDGGLADFRDNLGESIETAVQRANGSTVEIEEEGPRVNDPDAQAVTDVEAAVAAAAGEEVVVAAADPTPRDQVLERDGEPLEAYGDGAPAFTSSRVDVGSTVPVDQGQQRGLFSRLFGGGSRQNQEPEQSRGQGFFARLFGGSNSQGQGGPARM
jgi:hypothetical protein